MGTKHLTSYLFAHPSFMEGLGRTLDIGGTFDSYNESGSGKKADAIALKLDWMMVGEDMRSAIHEYVKKEQTQPAS